MEPAPRRTVDSVDKVYNSVLFYFFKKCILNLRN